MGCLLLDSEAEQRADAAEVGQQRGSAPSILPGRGYNMRAAVDREPRGRAELDDRLRKHVGFSRLDAGRVFRSVPHIHGDHGTALAALYIEKAVRMETSKEDAQWLRNEIRQ
jgi:hypothetical protein